MPIELHPRQRTDSAREVFFVFKGRDLPAYARESVRLALRFSGLRPHLLASAAICETVRSRELQTTALEDFYRPEEFRHGRLRISNSKSFRQGFWSLTAERLFIIEQFMRKSGAEEIIHAELDQLLFRMDLLAERVFFPGQRQGVFLPFQRSGEAIASILFVKGRQSLSNFTDFLSTSTVSFPNEMIALGEWSNQNPEICFALPTLASKQGNLRLSKEVALLTDSSESPQLITDPAQVGQWVFGADSRNLPLAKKPSNLFAVAHSPEMLTREELANTRLQLNPKDNSLLLFSKGYSYQLLNLHVHSKVHPWIASDSRNLLKALEAANQKKELFFPGQRLKQVHARTNRFLLSRFSGKNLLLSVCRQLHNLLGLKMSSAPFLSGDTFLKMATHLLDDLSGPEVLNYLPDNSVVFCASEDAERAIKLLRSSRASDVTLLLGNSDRDLSNEALGEVIHTNAISKVFAQNLTEAVPKCTPMPIGIENSRLCKHGRVSKFRKFSNHVQTNNRIHRIGWSFSLQTNFPSRVAAADVLTDLALADYFGALTPTRHLKKLEKYAFVASPRGNGLDTHRTWEAMYAGCVPIVERSYAMEFFEAQGLPMVLVRSWSELQNWDAEFLKNEYQRLKSRFSHPALWADTWKNKIRNTAR